MLRPWLDDGDVRLYAGDCVEVMRELAAESVDAICTDPPYGWRFMGKAWDGAQIEEHARQDAERRRTLGPHSPTRPGRETPRSASAFGSAAGQAGAYDESLTGNRAFQAWCETWAREALRILKPGGHLLSFCGPRTYHRMACAIEDAGFEVRDSLHWLYGSGFPKSLDVSKAIDEHRFREWLDEHPAEQARLAAARDAIREAVDAQAAQLAYDEIETALRREAGAERKALGPPTGIGNRDPKRHAVEPGYDGGHGNRWAAMVTAPATPEAAAWQGWGTALKPAHEPIVLARKPLAERTVARQVLATGTGGLNVDGTRVGATVETWPSSRGPNTGRAMAGGVMAARDTGDTPAGRWPPNCVWTHDWRCEEGDACAPAARCVSPDDAAECARLLTSLLNSLADCPSCHRFCDGRSRLVLEVAQELPQLPRGAVVGGSFSLRGTLQRIHDRLVRSRPSADDSAQCSIVGSIGESRSALVSRHGAVPETASDTARTGSSAQPRHAPNGGKLESRTSADAYSCGTSDRNGHMAEAVRLLMDWSSVQIVPLICPVAELDRQSGVLTSGTGAVKRATASGSRGNAYGVENRPAGTPSVEYGDTGGASRFFPTFRYEAKASGADRGDGNHHPTVKPLALMRWLVRLVTPPGGLVLDPFAGSGTTGLAARQEGMRAILIEREAEYLAMAAHRLRQLSLFA